MFATTPEAPASIVLIYGTEELNVPYENVPIATLFARYADQLGLDRNANLTIRNTGVIVPGTAAAAPNAVYQAARGHESKGN
jgi:hypothetical protein